MVKKLPPTLQVAVEPAEGIALTEHVGTWRSGEELVATIARPLIGADLYVDFGGITYRVRVTEALQEAITATRAPKGGRP